MRFMMKAGYVVSGVIVLLLSFDVIGKLLQLAPVVEGTAQLGYPTSLVVPLGAIELACIIAYAMPGTSFLGAILLTGYLGGAGATHLRVGDPLFTHALFPIYIGLLVWGGLCLRDAELRTFVTTRFARPRA